MTFSMNGRLILEVYKQTGLTPEMKNGIAMPGQRDGFKGLRILISTVLSDGRHIPAGSTAYIREEALYSQPWTKKIYKCDTINEPFIVADLSSVDMIVVPETAA